MVLGRDFINDCNCCPITSSCCCADINAGTGNLIYTIESDCAAFDGNTGCLIRTVDVEGCTMFNTETIVDDGNCSPKANIGMQARLECWSLTERTGFPPTDPNHIPPREPEYGYRLLVLASNPDCTGLVPNEILGDSGYYRPVSNLSSRPQCDPFEIMFDVPAPYNRPAGGPLPSGENCDCCIEGDNIRFIINSGSCHGIPSPP